MSRTYKFAVVQNHQGWQVTEIVSYHHSFERARKTASKLYFSTVIKWGEPKAEDDNIGPLSAYEVAYE